MAPQLINTPWLLARSLCAQCLGLPSAASVGAPASCSAVAGVDPDGPSGLVLTSGPSGTLLLDQDFFGGWTRLNLFM
mgnify:CR=1 FL=1